MERIGVLMGGCSSEREISIKSGKAVSQALSAAGWLVTPIELNTTDEREILALLRFHKVDGVFIALHGEFGEDGTIQSILERAGIAYTGSDATASRLAMHKGMTQGLLKKSGIPVPEYCLVRRGDPVDAAQMAAALKGFPIVVKPAGQGSSIGVSIVRAPEDFPAALEAAFGYDEEVIVESFIPGREFTAGVLDGEALPIVEICSTHMFFDFQAKYQAGMTEYIVPAPIAADLSGRMQAMALKAFDVLGCRDMARADCRMDAQGRIFFLEVNTIPGFTSTSLLPKAAREAGYSFEALCGKIVRLAMVRRSFMARMA